jgi:FtsP/CotA-like multicopper oxidase with cupredoxin domain
VRSQAATPDARVLRVRNTGYDGMVPGPELRVGRGEEFSIHVINELAEPTAVHWHGVRLVNAMDGTPPLTQTPIAPGASLDYRFIAPDAGTFCYHPPAPAASGLHGAFVVAETEPVDVDHEATLIFAAAKNADTFTVNGANLQSIFAAANQRMRLRLINVCIAQILRLHVAELRTFVMAIDGQPAQPFVARDGELTLGPGNRMDVFVDCTLVPDASALIAIENNDGVSAPIARIICKGAEPGRATPRDDPKPLPSNPLPERMDFQHALRVDTAIGRSAATKADAPLFTVKRGRTAVLGLSNPTSENGFIHLHGHSFRLLDVLDDGWKPFWLDTMPIAPRGKARVAFVADNPGKWLIEGLAQSGTGVWFEVT